MPHNVISDALNILESRPREGLISFFLRRYALIQGVSITALMIIGAAPCAPYWTTMWIAFYWVYHGWKKKRRIGKRDFFGLPYHSKWVQFSRAVILIICVAIFWGYLRLKTGCFANPNRQDTLWLLFLLAIFIMSQYGMTELMIVTIGLASTALTIILLLSHPTWNSALYQEIGAKIIWLTLIALVLHVLLRFTRDWYASVRFLHDWVGEQLMPIRSISEEKQFLTRVVKQIASDFKYPHVNVLYVQPDQSVKYVAGACPAGQALAEEEYVLKEQKGIIRRVVETGKIYSSNNITQDQCYVSQAKFPRTKAEIAVPIKLRGKIIGILDVQTPQKDVFFFQDGEVLEIMAGYIARALDNIRLLESRQQINRIVGNIAHRFLSEHELESSLKLISQTAHEALKADVVVVYEYDPLAGNIVGPVCAGELYHPELFSATAFEPDSIVQRLLLVADKDYFQPVVEHIPGPVPTASKNGHSPGKPKFVSREKIASRAIIRLRTGTNCVGLMFLNFRTSQKFEEAVKDKFFSFAHLAALAIQKSQFHRQQLDFERQNLGRQLHDQLIANASAVERIITVLLRDKCCTDAERIQLMNARDAARELKRDIRYINETLKDASLDSLVHEVDKAIERARNAYDVGFDLRWRGQNNHVPSDVTAQLKLILNEAVINAVRHGEATHLALTCDVSNHHIRLVITDNGQGFDSKRVKPGGLVNMQERTKRLGGEFEVDRPNWRPMIAARRFSLPSQRAGSPTPI